MRALVIAVLLLTIGFAQPTTQSMRSAEYAKGSVALEEQYVFVFHDSPFDFALTQDIYMVTANSEEHGYFVSPEEITLELSSNDPKKKPDIVSRLALDVLKDAAQKEHILLFAISAEEIEVANYGRIKNTPEFRDKLNKMLDDGSITYELTRRATFANGETYVDGTFGDKTIRFEGVDHYYLGMVQAVPPVAHAFSQEGQYIADVIPGDPSTYPKEAHVALDDNGDFIHIVTAAEVFKSEEFVKTQPPQPTQRKQEIDNRETSIVGGAQDAIDDTIHSIVPKGEDAKEKANTDLFGYEIPTIAFAFVFLGILGFLAVFKR